MKNLISIVSVLSAAIMFCVPSDSWAKGKRIPFTQAQIRIELNSTDQDSGLHVLLDAEGWRWVRIFNPRGKEIFSVHGGGNVKKTGLTELFFESAEPGFEELPLAEFLKRFPEGVYRFTGETIEGDALVGRARLTHKLPAGPVLLSPQQNSVQDPNNTIVVWEPVADPAGSQITRYEVLITQEEPKPKRVLSAVVPATATSFDVPPQFLVPNTEFKYEVLAIEKGGNQTLSEGVFQTAP